MDMGRSHSPNMEELLFIVVPVGSLFSCVHRERKRLLNPGDPQIALSASVILELGKQSRLYFH